MTLFESFMVALFCLLGVFVVLLALTFIINFFSLLVGSMTRKKKEGVRSDALNTEQAHSFEEEIFSSGNLLLRDVDEPTAAMIMAIVSDESGIPLSELCFKSIKRIRPNEVL